MWVEVGVGKKKVAQNNPVHSRGANHMSHGSPMMPDDMYKSAGRHAVHAILSPSCAIVRPKRIKGRKHRSSTKFGHGRRSGSPRPSSQTVQETPTSSSTPRLADVVSVVEFPCVLVLFLEVCSSVVWLCHKPFPPRHFLHHL